MKKEVAIKCNYVLRKDIKKRKIFSK